MTQWIKHNGGLCPVPPDWMVEIKCRDGVVNGPAKAKHMNWGYKVNLLMPDKEITEYRVIESAKEETVQEVVSKTETPTYEERLRDEFYMRISVSIISEEGWGMSEVSAERYFQAAHRLADQFIAARKQKEGGM